MKNKLIIILALITLMGCEVSVEKQPTKVEVKKIIEKLDNMLYRTSELLGYVKGYNEGKVEGMYRMVTCVKAYGEEECFDRYNRMIERLRTGEELQ